MCILQTESWKQQMLGSDKCCREEGNFKKTREMFCMLASRALGSTLPLKKMKCYHCSRNHHPSICDTLSKNFIDMSGTNPNSNTQKGKPGQPQQTRLPQGTIRMPQNQITPDPYVPVQKEMGEQAQNGTGQVP